MNPYLFGKASALSKFAELGPALKALLEHAGIGAATGGAMGGVTGAIAAPEGKRLEGMGKGVLGGGLMGGALGAGGGHLLGNRGAPAPASRGIGNLAPGGHALRAGTGLLGAGGAGALGGAIGGAAAAPNEDTIWEKLKGKLGLG